MEILTEINFSYILWLLQIAAEQHDNLYIKQNICQFNLYGVSVRITI